jgi:phenylacetic acid degradation operon negative regulatory protein
VVRPFDIEEIFPDVAAGPVRLPRRQAGSSPQGLTVTLLADYTLRTGAWLPSAAIVALLGESGVSSAGARTAISRLARRGVLEGSRQGRRSSYRLTEPAALSLSVGGNCILAFPEQAEAWDGAWTLVVFTLPQDQAAQRRALRSQLRWLGYAPLYDGLWVSPRDLTPRAAAELAEVNLGALTVFRARQVEVATLTRRDPRQAWDISDIARQYDSFVAAWSPLLARVRAGAVRGPEAVRARTQVMDTYRRFRFLDPQLPLRLMPAGWLRNHARDVFVGVYDGLAAVAEEHVRGAVGRAGGGSEPDVRAHTSAELLARLRPAPAAMAGPVPAAMAGPAPAAMAGPVPAAPATARQGAVT